MDRGVCQSRGVRDDRRARALAFFQSTLVEVFEKEIAPFWISGDGDGAFGRGCELGEDFVETAFLVCGVEGVEDVGWDSVEEGELVEVT